ncbi:MAG: GNAT family N-acetyltransferase [bacterium]|nr:GNAT family N-acetyltransferase [bacterium]
MMDIRTLDQGDVIELSRLVGEVANYHHEIDPVYKSHNQYSGLKEMVEGWLTDADTLVLLAEENKKLIGYIRIGVEPAPEYSTEKKIGMVYDAFIEEESRRQGIAELLFQRSLEWFAKKGVENIELNVDARNSGAIEFWRQLDFADYKIRMRRPLDL